MKVSKIFTYFKATINVEVEGFFIERFINLCKINNINIWDITYVNSGRIKFSTEPNEYKKLKPFLNKTKCKSKITNKKGIYFELFRYRKRRNVIILSILGLIMWITLSTFIWKIEIKGNEKVKDEEILIALEEKDIVRGKNKYFISKGEAVDYIRTKLYDIAWVGLEFEGTTLNVSVVEKIIDEESEDVTEMGDVIATKSGIITRIIAKNGTALFKEGRYIEEGMTAIKGSIKGEYMEEQKVHAAGILKIKAEYSFEKEYFYKEKIKEYTGNTRYGVGIGINNKKNVIKCLRKENKYDISSKEKIFEVFGTKISFIFNTYNEYEEYNITNSLEELMNKGKRDSGEYINKIKNTDSKILKEEVNVENIENRYKVYCIL